MINQSNYFELLLFTYRFFYSDHPEIDGQSMKCWAVPSEVGWMNHLIIRFDWIRCRIGNGSDLLLLKSNWILIPIERSVNPFKINWIDQSISSSAFNELVVGFPMISEALLN